MREFSPVLRVERPETARDLPEEMKRPPLERWEADEVLAKNIGFPDLATIENTSLSALMEQNRFREARLSPEAGEQVKGLTAEEKARIKEETGWSDEIIDEIGSMEEYEIYKLAGLQEAEVDGRKCLIRKIDPEQTDADGLTNRQRMERGLAPVAENGEIVELHHIGQRADSPLAELTPQEHRSKETYKILHDTSKESEIDRVQHTGERKEHWKARVSDY